MADEFPLAGLSNQTVEMALEAYDDGYRIIACWFNEAFDAWKIGLRIEADPPPPGVTLDDCRRRLSNSLLGIRPLCPDLLSDDQLCPWAVGFLRAERDQTGEVMGGIGMRDNPLSPWRSANAVKNIVAVKHGYGWKDAGQWRDYVVKPMEQNANSWREWLRQFLSSNADAGGAVQQPLTLLVGSGTPTPGARTSDIIKAINDRFKKDAELAEQCQKKQGDWAKTLAKRITSKVSHHRQCVTAKDAQNVFQNHECRIHFPKS